VTAVLADDDQAVIPAALALTGIDPDAAVSVVRLAVAPAPLHSGDNAELEIALRPDWNRQATAAYSYVIEFARSAGRPSCKFHTGHDSLAPGEPPELRRRYAFRPMSTGRTSPTHTRSNS
jgi:hypothetical protein